jgi:hypothetical protein
MPNDEPVGFLEVQGWRPDGLSGKSVLEFEE